MTNKLTGKELADAIERVLELDAKRTQGTWKGNESGWGDLFICTQDTGHYVAEIEVPDNTKAEVDCAFIASAPPMASIIRALHAELMAAREALVRASSMLSEEHRLVLKGKRWAEQTLTRLQPLAELKMEEV